MKQEIVNVNGRAYDPVTGLLLPISITKETAPQPTRPHVSQTIRGAHTTSIHQRHVKKSATLSRRHVKRSAPTPLAARPAKKTAPVHVAQHEAVHKFTPTHTPTPTSVTPPQASKDRPAETHPVVHRAKQHEAAKAAPIQVEKSLKPARVLKNEAISEALAKEVKPQKSHRAKRKQSSFSRWLSIASAGVAIMLLGGYFTYLSMPNISIRVAALQSGINATYPGYKPSGYALNGPISFKQGEVSMKFAYADGTASYTISQTKSDWDSAAVKEYIADKSGAPTTTIVDGLTIFASGENIAWVNGGILYHINSQAPLSGEQIRRIATSM